MSSKKMEALIKITIEANIMNRKIKEEEFKIVLWKEAEIAAAKGLFNVYINVVDPYLSAAVAKTEGFSVSKYDGCLLVQWEEGSSLFKKSQESFIEVQKDIRKTIWSAANIAATGGNFCCEVFIPQTDHSSTYRDIDLLLVHPQLLLC